MLFDLSLLCVLLLPHQKTHCLANEPIMIVSAILPDVTK